MTTWSPPCRRNSLPKYAISSSTSPTIRTTLKQQLIQRTCLPEQRRLRQLFHSMELGDRKPTQLLRRMRQLLRDGAAITPPTPDTVEALVKRMEELVSTLSTRSRSPRLGSPSPRRRQPRLRSPPPPSLSPTSLCWYHRRFGDRARNCTPPCAKSGNDEASR